MNAYFTELLLLTKKLNINIFDAFIAQKISEQFPDLSIEEFENICSEFKDNYLKNEYVTLDDLIMK